METMGERIRQLRQQNNMSQEELGKHLGIGRSAVLKYEKGEVENIPRSSIEKMAVIFGVSPAYLMGFEEWDEKQLADDVALIERIQARWGEDAVEVLHKFIQINHTGHDLLLDFMDFCIDHFPEKE